MWSALFIAAALAAPEGYRPPVDIPAGCRFTHYLPDGRRIELTGTGGAGAGTSASTQASASSRAQSSVAVSASSSSSSSGTRQARASAVADGGGRSVTHTQDESGCRIVVDDRPAGEDP